MNGNVCAAQAKILDADPPSLKLPSSSRTDLIYQGTTPDKMARQVTQKNVATKTSAFAKATADRLRHEEKLDADDTDLFFFPLAFFLDFPVKTGIK